MAREGVDKREYQDPLSLDDKYKWMAVGPELRRDFYVFSGSLSRYIIENYGKKYFMDLYVSEGVECLQSNEGRGVYEEWYQFIGGGSR